MMDAHVGL